MEMFKKTCAYIFVFILTLFNILGSAANDDIKLIKPEEAVKKAFAESKAEILETNINSHITLKNELITIDNGKKICKDISERLNMTEVSIKEDANENFLQITLRGLIAEGVHGTLIVQSSRFGDFKESNIVLDIISTNGEYDLGKICDKIREVLSIYGKAKLNITLTGYYDKYVDNKNLEKKIKSMMKSVEAKEIERAKTDDFISITGYTPSIKEYINVVGKKANINIAGTYNEYAGRTEILIGTPLIVLEY
jgi:hypothetical protein